MKQTVQVMTPLGLQTYLWVNGALTRLEDQNEELVADTVERSEPLRTSLTAWLEIQGLRTRELVYP
jgi:hypothetical protein